MNNYNKEELRLVIQLFVAVFLISGIAFAYQHFAGVENWWHLFTFVFGTSLIVWCWNGTNEKYDAFLGISTLMALAYSIYHLILSL